MSDEARRAERFGWTSLLVWVLFGLALEVAHGFKLGAYLDDDLRRTLLRLAHAHGVILALVALAAGRVDRSDGAATVSASRTGMLIRAGALLIPIGFATAAIVTHEGDPGLAVGLVPLGAVLLVVGLARIVVGHWRAHR